MELADSCPASAVLANTYVSDEIADCSLVVCAHLPDNGIHFEQEVLWQHVDSAGGGGVPEQSKRGAFRPDSISLRTSRFCRLGPRRRSRARNGNSRYKPARGRSRAGRGPTSFDFRLRACCATS